VASVIKHLILFIRNDKTTLIPWAWLLVAHLGVVATTSKWIMV